MKILFFRTRNFEYVQDLTYSGLVKLLGRDRIIEIPLSFDYRMQRRQYPKNLGFTNAPKWDGLLGRFNKNNIAALVLATPRLKPLQDFSRYSKRFPDVPHILIDGGDRPEIGGDFKRHGGEALFRELQKKRPFDYIFKREMFLNQDYAENIFPFPISINPDVFKVKNQGVYDKQVVFWGVDSHPIRKQAFTILKGKFDCDQNGTTVVDNVSGYAFRGAEYHKQLASARIALSLRGSGVDTLRYWEIPFFNGPLLVTTKPEIIIPNPFTDGESICHVNQDLSDLVDKCQFYIDNETERRRVQQAGTQHLLKYHTDLARAKYLVEKASL